MLPLDLIPLGLFPLDVAPDRSGESGFGSFLPLLLIVLAALIVMVGVLFFVRSRRGKQ